MLKNKIYTLKKILTNQSNYNLYLKTKITQT